MICAIYKSSRKADTYLYVSKKNEFSSVPEPLMQSFGTPQMVMMLNLKGQKKLALADIDKVTQELAEHGFYLQLPPPNDNLLDQHLKAQGKK